MSNKVWLELNQGKPLKSIADRLLVKILGTCQPKRIARLKAGYIRLLDLGKKSVEKYTNTDIV